MSELNWLRPKRCESGACPEVARTPAGNVLVRSSLLPGDVVAFTATEFADFLEAVKAGDFDDLRGA